MCRAERVERNRPLVRTILWTAAIATLPAIAIQTGLAAAPYSEGNISSSIAQAVGYWPMVYFAIAGLARHRRGKVIQVYGKS
jgi:hypothetical protein